ncbi:methylaspartate mutase accessory protein GlmL [Desulfotomaculum copahuensis]|uniref:MutL protein n=1 Tax=Desulfotomaculum copahuensis TaxID=1838280 RepID=A0A1B7LDW3_9FIRM|nr:methylaspartate mutase accessory protein GlmL [Desulfotomaculum copahuensis]OAT81245.1 MutL protein [Desulfotomaculum copahuensis]
MALALLMDIGSTYTKAVALDLEKAEVTAAARAPTTVQEITRGLARAVSELEKQLGGRPDWCHRLACSSAAGGLKMVAIGLVPGLTAKAARWAALGAGARVLKVYAHELAGREVTEIEALKPDIILLAGGTDGGNRRVLLHNAGRLADSRCPAAVILAGNKAAADEAASLLAGAGKDVRLAENVLPELDRLNVDPARQLIRQVFLEKIIHARGLDRTQQYLEGVLMPTPAAVLSAAELLARGTAEESGLGDLLVVDVGGATTDVYSICSGQPTRAGVSLKGLPEPYAKRTVEGDLGMRVSAPALYEAAGPRLAAEAAGMEAAAVRHYVELVHREPFLLPAGETQWRLETALAVLAVRLAVERHAGYLETFWTPVGATPVQHGKDLTAMPLLIGTGGVITAHPDPGPLLSAALYREAEPHRLLPRAPALAVDRGYILAAAGLLAEVAPDAALRAAKKNLLHL